MKQRTIFTPATVSDFAREGKSLAYWKQILPEGVVNYRDKIGRKRSVNFDDLYLANLMKAFTERKVNQTPFQLADVNNAHTMDAERFRGEVTEMRLASDGEKPGLYGKVVFPNKAAAKAVVLNPGLGVSARIREDEDGPAIIHVLGTLDPQVTGMESWKPVDLSTVDGKVLDLSNEVITEGSDMRSKVAIKDRKADSFTREEIDAMSEADLDEYLTTFAVDENGEPLDLDDLDDEDDDDDSDDDDDDADDDADDDDDDEGDDPVKADLSTRRSRRDIELANSRAATADARASEALRRVAQTAWEGYRANEINLGVPAFLLDLAEPVLNRADDMEIDLSNTDEDNINVSEIARKFVEASRGIIDMSNESGHSGHFDGNGPDPDEKYLEQWDREFPTN